MTLGSCAKDTGRLRPGAVWHRHRISDYWQNRRLWVGLCLALGLAASCMSGKPAALSPQGLAEWLGSATDQTVSPDDIGWEPQRNFITEALCGRRLLFLAAPQTGEPRDLYRATVRLGFGGQPISVSNVKNLTRTPLGDDAGLQVFADHAVFATVAFGKIQGITVLDLGGLRDEDVSGTAFEKLLLKFTNMQMSGSWSGLGRTDLVFNVPSAGANLELDATRVSVNFHESERDLKYDLVNRTLRAADGSQPYGVKVVPNRHPGKPFILWSVDTTREEVGPEAIAWLENQVFGAKDVVKRLAFSFTPSSDVNALRDPAAPASAAPVTSAKPATVAASASRVRVFEENWPPPPIASLWKQAEPGEGQWVAASEALLRPSRAMATPGTGPTPAYFYKTFTRPDPKRPYAKAWFIAMDMRQLTLGMQAGFEDPEPLTGPAGEGRLPDDPSILSRVVGTFNGAFKSEHGKYGMMVAKRVLLPPVPGAATVAITNSREVAFGSWPKSPAIPDDLLSFRQNLDPLVEDGQVNPTGRQIWGWQLQGTSVMTERTAMCVTGAGHIYYVWAEETDAKILGEALRQAGCSYALHLDMNPGHCGFIYTRVNDFKKRDFAVKRAVDKMSVPPERYVRWSPKDFFYVLLREPVPQDATEAHWLPDGGTQPPPNWWPALFASKVDVSGANVELLSVEKGRVEWAVRAVTLEPRDLGAALMKTDLEEEPSHRMLLALGLGHTTPVTRYGLAFEGKQSLPFKNQVATLVVSPPHSIAIYQTPPSQLSSNEEAVQLPLLARDGELTSEGRSQGTLRPRAALCVTPEGRTLIGRARSDSSIPMARVLLRAGCRDVVELDRGSSHPSYLHRTGTDHPPTGGYETTTLYALSQVMQPSGVRWKPAGSSPSTKPTLYDAPRREKSKGN